jgi:sugar-specific transcriptional regulator TrmB
MSGYSPPPVPDLIRELEILGLDGTEAAVYVCLTQSGPMKASDLAATLELRRPDAYRVLQRLIDRGFVTAVLARPTLFQASTPERVFAEALRQQEAARERIAQARPGIVAALDALRGSTRPDPESLAAIHVVHGRAEGLRAFDRLLHGARDEVLLVSTSHGLGLDAPGSKFLDVVLRRAQEGLRIRAVLGDVPETLVARRHRLPATFEVRRGRPDGPMRFAIADRRETVVWMVTDPSPRRTADGDVVEWTTAKESIERHRLLFEYLWREAEPLADNPPEAWSGTLPPRAPPEP